MATTITATTLIDQVGDEVPGLLWKFIGTATASGATLTTTDPEINKFGSTNADTTRFASLFLWIPGGTAGTDDIHSVTTLSVSAATTTITTLGNYAATYTNAAMYLIGIHPTIFLRLINDALELELHEYTAPLCHYEWTDNDMSSSGTTGYTQANADETLSKVTTAANNFELLRALRVQNASANGGALSAAMKVTTGSQYLAWAIGRSASGTAAMTVKGSSTDESITTTESRFQYLYDTGSVGSDESIQIRLGGTEASADTYWAAGAFQPIEDSLIILPSWADERFKVRAIMRGYFGFEHGTGVADAFSRELVPLQEGIDYTYQNAYASVNANALQIHRRWLSYPLWIKGLRPYSDLGTFSAVSDTTPCPLHVLVPRVKWLMGDRYGEAFPGLKEKAESQIKRRAALRQTEIPHVARELRMFS